MNPRFAQPCTMTPATTRPIAPSTPRWRRAALRWLATLACALAVAPVAAQARECAVVVIHGKWGNPQYISFFGRKLKPACDFEAVEMPWSQRREYDADYPAALAEIDRQVQAFRQQGYRRVVLAGHSFGANAALAYMAAIGAVDAVVLMAPGHTPEIFYAGATRDSVDQARARVAEGKGDDMLSAVDVNQGQRRTLRVRASAYLSYFDPDGLGSMPVSASRFRKAVPVLWVIGSGDRLIARGPGYVFERLPPHPKSQYLVVTADHAGTPDVAADAVRDWLAALP